MTLYTWKINMYTCILYNVYIEDDYVNMQDNYVYVYT